MATAVFTPSEGDRFVASELARGPWDPDAQHGSPPAALLMRAFERIHNPNRLALARVTYELQRPVPLAELEVRTEPVRQGRRVELLDGEIRGEDGAILVRGRALRVQPTEASIPPTSPGQPPERPEHGSDNDYPVQEHRTFATDGMEIRFVAGRFGESGPATAWFRLRSPLVAGEETSPLQRLAAAADFGNGIGNAVPWDRYTFVNTDLTIYIEREPVGEWVCLQAETRLTTDGVAVAESRLYDERGPVGLALQALLVSRR